MPVPSVTAPPAIRRALPPLLLLLTVFGPISMDLYLPALPALTADLGAVTSVAQLTVTAVSLKSVALGVVYFTAAPAALVAVAVMSAGGVNAGGASSTVTLNAVLAGMCELFVTLQLTAVVPIGNVEPGAGAQAAVSVPSL